jgi:hypothetical protein
MEPPEPVTRRELHRSLAGIAIIVLVLVTSSLLLFTELWFIWPIILMVILLAIGALTVSKKPWQCPSCGTVFKITALQDLFAPHGMSRGSKGELLEWKILKCPACGKRSTCHPVRAGAAEELNEHIK